MARTMAKRITITLDEKMSKAEELKILQRLHEAYSARPYSGLYLESLFSKRLINWSELRMRNDFPVDPMEFVDGYYVIQTEKDVEITRLSNVKEVLHKDLASAEQRLSAMDERNIACAERIVELERMNAEKGRRIETLQSTEEAYRDEVAKMTVEMAMLKARLYDFEHKE